MDTTTCPECAAPAEVTDRFALESTDGPIEHVKVQCVAWHWFLLPTATLARHRTAARPTVPVPRWPADAEPTAPASRMPADAEPAVPARAAHRPTCGRPTYGVPRGRDRPAAGDHRRSCGRATDGERAAEVSPPDVPRRR